MANQTKQYPKDGLVIISMLKELGIVNYEPRVINQLLEFTTRYLYCVLDDARAFANHSKKKTIDIEDIKLAIGMQMEKVFTTPPPRDLLLEVARSKNNIPLPIVKSHCGIRLPPDRHCFSACNFKLKPTSKKIPEKTKYNLCGPTGNQINTNLNNGPPMKMAKTSGGLPSGSLLGNSGTSGGMPIVKRPATSSVARSQAITAVAKPLIKLNTNPTITSQQQSQLQQPKARIQVSTVGGSGQGNVSTVSHHQQTTSSQIHQTHSQPSHSVEIKVEPSDSCSSTTETILTTGEQQLMGIKRKREDEFGGLENQNWRRLVIAVPQSSTSTYKMNRGKSMPWNRQS